MAFQPSNPSNPSNPSSPPFGGGPRFSRGREFHASKDEHRINERIRVPQVRLIDEKGNQVGVVPTYEALQMARERGLDLMEISPNSSPPVCKICDYGKFKYEKKKKDAVAKKKQVAVKVKEIQLRPMTDDHDVSYKMKHMREFLGEGDKVRAAIAFRGREMTHRELGAKILKKLTSKKVKRLKSSTSLKKMKLIPFTMTIPTILSLKRGRETLIIS